MIRAEKANLRSGRNRVHSKARLTPPRLNMQNSRRSLATGLAKEPVVKMDNDVLAAEKVHPPVSRGDALDLYLREIGQVKLLTAQEEIVLAKRIRKGDAEARELMIKANLRLVVKIARDYSGLGLPLLDLINEGNIGLMKGVERFDPRKGAKLSTYTAWWIKQSIKRALANQCCLR